MKDPTQCRQYHAAHLTRKLLPNLYMYCAVRPYSLSVLTMRIDVLRSTVHVHVHVPAKLGTHDLQRLHLDSVFKIRTTHRCYSTTGTFLNLRHLNNCTVLYCWSIVFKCLEHTVFNLRLEGICLQPELQMQWTFFWVHVTNRRLLGLFILQWYRIWYCWPFCLWR